MITVGAVQTTVQALVDALQNCANNEDDVLLTREALAAGRAFLAQAQIASRAPRESQMVVLERDAKGTPTIWCDPEIVPIVQALNAAGMRTVASCSGHGERPANIALADGREVIIARSYAEARAMEAARQHSSSAVEHTDSAKARKDAE